MLRLKNGAQLFRQPRGFFQPNWNHPAFRGASSVLIQCGPFFWANGRQSSVNLPLLQTMGDSLKYGASSRVPLFTVDSTITQTATFVVYRADSYNSVQATITAEQWYADYHVTDSLIRMGSGGSASSATRSDVTFNNPLTKPVAFTANNQPANSANWSIYVDGQPATGRAYSGSATTYGSGQANGAAFSHGWDAASNVNANTRAALWIRIGGKNLSDTELAWLSRNPWQLFIQAPDFVYFDDYVASGGDSSGPLIVTETGDDLFTSIGDVIVSGTLAATETGSDSFASTGDVIVSGTLSATETGSDSFSATGSVIVSGTLAATETGDDTFQGSGAAISSGTLAATETGNDTFSATGTQVSTGGLAVTETGQDTFSATGNVIVSGTLTATETGSDTFTGVGGNVSVGSLDATETGNDSFTATGSVLVEGALSATEQNDTFSATGNVIVSGTLVVTETGQDTFSSAGGAVVAGTLAATESGSDAFASSGTFVSTGALSATEQSDTFSAAGNVIVQGALTVTEQSDTFTATGGVVIAGAFSATETGIDVFQAYDAGTAPTSAIADTQWSLIIKEYRKISAVKNTDFRAVVK